MKKVLLTLTICLLLSLFFSVSRVSGQEQEPEKKGNPKPIILSESQQKEATQAASLMKIRNDEWIQAVNDALNSPLEATRALEALGRMQTANALLDAARARFESVRDKHRLIHNCGNCNYSEDGKSLVKPPSNPTK